MQDRMDMVQGMKRIISWLVILLNVYCVACKVLEDWRNACVVNLFEEKGWQCSDYGGKSLLNVVKKVYCSMLMIKESIKNLFLKKLDGFRKEIGCIHQIFAAMHLCYFYDNFF